MGKEKIDSRYLLDKIREYNKNEKRINENELPGVSTLSDMELEDETNRFKEAVGSTAEFNDFKIYDNKIEWSGLLPVENIAWSFSLDNNNGCYITVNSLQLNTESLERINKLSAYYNVWSEYWMKEINN